MAKILDIIQTFNVKLALKNIFTKIDEIIRYLNGLNIEVTEVTGTLTADQINSLDTTPVTVLGPAGENKFYVVENCVFHYRPGTTGFTTESNLRLEYNVFNRFITIPITDTILNDTVEYFYTSFPSNGSFQYIINDSIVVRGPGEISGGNGRIDYSIKYRTITTL